jgi:flavin reductase (DIM6/NTAB) family NADH-FMN oxidoreductase RutF
VSTEQAFDDLMARLDAPMVVVTTVAGGERSGCLAGFHSQAGIEPRALAVWLSTANHTHGVARRAEMFAVHFLSQDDHGLARLFGTLTGDEVDKFVLCAWHEGPGGVPVLDGVEHRVVGRRLEMREVACDHALLLLQPVLVDGGPRLRPLRLSDVSELDAGHPPGER